ncbi:MAG: HU family DNA-binding protein [Polyangia bacterium]
MPVTKSELIDSIADKLHLAKARAEQIVDTVFNAMVDALKEGQGIEIRGFGSFTIREYRAYDGRNPRTGEIVKVAQKRLPFFKVGKELRERVNASRAALAPAEPGDEDDDDADDEA